VTGARAPFWLVLGQSHSVGWRATVDGRSLGEPVVIDGFANGWLVSPSAGGRDLEVALTWAPQRRVWAMLAMSLIGILVCLALIWRSPGRARSEEAAPQPALEPVTRHRGRRPRRRTIVGIAVGVFVVVAAVATPPTGALVGAAALVTLLRRRARALTTVGAAVAVAGAGLYTVALQLARSYPAVSEWPGFFRVSHNLAWIAVALLAADVVVGLARERAGPAPPR
jgi:hypothetical protein